MILWRISILFLKVTSAVPDKPHYLIFDGILLGNTGRRVQWKELFGAGLSFKF